jgi:hypothetical protein
MAKKWFGRKPEACQLCDAKLGEDGFFFDARLRDSGHWALICEDCHRVFGSGLGTGLGQQYRLDNLVKVGG